MTTLPEEAVKAAIAAHNKYYDDLVIYPSEEPTPEGAFHAALKGALPFLPVQVAGVSADARQALDRFSFAAQQWGWQADQGSNDAIINDTKAEFDASYAALERILSATEPSAAREQIPSGYRLIPKQPTETMLETMAFNLSEAFGSNFVQMTEEYAMAVYNEAWTLGIKPEIAPVEAAARELALEEGYRQGIEAAQIIETKQEGFQVRGGGRVLIDRSEGDQSGLGYAAAIRALSSPDHPDAGKVEGDGRADLERFWRPISEADKSITFDETFDLGDGKSMTIGNSDYYWVRDADGRVYEATWSDHKAGYWWDLEGESPADPVEYMPHPLSLSSAPASEDAE